MKADKITIEVEAKLTVSKETAETALKLVETYMNNNDGLYIHAKRNADGTKALTFESQFIE